MVAKWDNLTERIKKIGLWLMLPAIGFMCHDCTKRSRGDHNPDMICKNSKLPARPDTVYQMAVSNNNKGAGSTYSRFHASCFSWFCGTNGTNSTISYKSVDITLTDESLGTICDIGPTDYWDSITPGRSKVFTVHVDPSNVLTGTVAWGSVHSNCKIKY